MKIIWNQRTKFTVCVITWGFSRQMTNWLSSTMHSHRRLCCFFGQYNMHVLFNIIKMSILINNDHQTYPKHRMLKVGFCLQWLDIQHHVLKQLKAFLENVRRDKVYQLKKYVHYCHHLWRAMPIPIQSDSQLHP